MTVTYIPSGAPAGVLGTALSGILQAQDRVQAGAAQVAAGNLDPAVILDIRQAELSVAANAATVRADSDNFRRLLDVTA